LDSGKLWSGLVVTVGFEKDMAKLQGANDSEKLKNLCSKTYKDQAIWFLNAFWDEIGDQAELFWKWVHKLAQLDLQKGANGNEVDELNQHRFLEFFHETMTVAEMRDNLRSTGAITGTVRMIPLSHYLIYRFKIDWHTLVNAAQGDNRKEIENAQRLLDEVQVAFKEAEAKAESSKAAFREAAEREANAKKRDEAAKKSEAEAKVSEAAAKEREAESRQRENESRAAQEELQAALAELHAQEEAFNNKTAELKGKSEDESIGLVTRNKAKAELAQHLASDPLPLRRSKINQEAAVKKADKATAAAAEARAAAETAANQATKDRHHAEDDARQASQARSEAEEARHHAEAAKVASEKAAEEMRVKFEEAEAYFNEVKSRPGSAKGALWWIERELHEAKAYLPEKKGGYKKQA